jgi:hypothetical protein
MRNRKDKQSQFRPDARHSEFWTSMVPTMLLVGVVYVLIALIWEYFKS